MDLAYILPNTSSLSADQDLTMTSLMLPYLCVVILAAISGTVGNVLVIGAVIVNKRLRKVGNLLIVNLAVADLCVTTVVDPFSVVGVLYGPAWLTSVPGLCDVLATLCLVSCGCSLLSIGAISFNRYVHICHDRYYTKIYSTRNTIIICVGLWVFCFFVDLPSFVGWGGHAFDDKTRICVWDRTAFLSYSIFIACVGVVIPVLVISLCYVRIYFYVKQQQKQFEKQGYSKGKKESLKLAKTLFVIFVVFVCCWAPYGVLIVADINNTFPGWLHLYSSLIAHTNSSINFIIYGLQDKNFRNGYKKLLHLDKCGKTQAKVVPMEGNSDSQSTLDYHETTINEEI